MGKYLSFDNTTMTNASLTDALLVKGSGIVIDENSVIVQYGTSQEGSSLSFYTAQAGDGLNIDNGLLLTNGSATPSESNTSTGYSTTLTNTDGTTSTLIDSDLSQTATLAFSGSGEVYDATALQFNFTIDDLFVHGIKLDLVFGSDEYPEYSDSSYVDIAGVYLNGNNIALFNGSELQPLSVISQNISVGNFQDNKSGAIPIEYDGLSNKLTIYAPVQPGENTIKIAIADTGDTILDSGVYIANFSGTQLTGDGISSVTSGTSGNDDLTGSADSETFETGDGDDTIDPGAGNDIILAGAGDDTIIGGNGDNQIDGGSGRDTVKYSKFFNDTYVKVMDNHTIHVGKNSDNLLNVEIIEFNDKTFDTANLIIEDGIAKIYIAYFGRAADAAGMKYWLDQAKTQIADGRAYSDVIFDIASAYSDSSEAESIYTGINAGVMDKAQLTTFVSGIYTNLFNRDAEQAGIDYWVADGLQLQKDGINLGTIVKSIIDGAQDQTAHLDRTFMQNKAQVAWDYAKQYELSGKEWSDTNASQYTEAQTVLTGITTATDSVNAQFDTILTLV